MAVIGAIGAIIVLVAGKTFHVQLLVGMTVAVAASANFPVLLLALTWRRFNSAGVVVGIAFGRRQQLGLDSFDEVSVRSTTGLGAEVASSQRSQAPREPAPREPAVAR